MTIPAWLYILTAALVMGASLWLLLALTYIVRHTFADDVTETADEWASR